MSEESFELFDDDELDEEDEIRRQILEAESNQFWLEEPGEEEELPADENH